MTDYFSPLIQTLDFVRILYRFVSVLHRQFVSLRFGPSSFFPSADISTSATVALKRDIK